MLSIMNKVAQRQKRNSIRDAIAGAAIALLIGFEAVAFSVSSRDTHEAISVEEPVPTQVENSTDPDELICTPESVAVVC